MTARVRPLHREPLVVALVLLNVSLGGMLLHREFGAPRRGLPAGHPDVAVPATDFGVSGTVTLSAALKEKWPAGAPVFVIARGEKGGPPFAARRYDGVTAPFKYSLGPGDVMLGGAAPKRLAISVRVDQDGDAMTRQLGDLEGGPSALVGPRGSVDVVVDRPARLTP